MGLEGVGENKMLGLRLIPSFPDKKKVEEDNPDNHLEATDRMKLPQLQYLLSDCQKTRQSANQLNMEFWHQALIIGMQIRVTPQSQFCLHQLQHLLPICPKIHQAANQLNTEVFLLKRVQIKITAQNQFHQPSVVVNLPKISHVSQPTELGSLPPIVHQRNANTDHTLELVSPAPVAIPPAIFKKNSTVSQPTQHGSVPTNDHKRTANKSHTPEPVSPEFAASPPQKVEHNPPMAHPIFPTITPSILPAPVTSPTSAFPVNLPLVHPIVPAVSPSKLPAPVSSPVSIPSRSFNWKKGGAPVAAPLYKTPKPLPAVIVSPAQDQAIPPSLPTTSG